MWEERFKSILVQGKRNALSAIAAYIDLNAVRAGIVNDPKDYRFCGYAEAVAGSPRARQGLVAIMAARGQSQRWKTTSAEYRKLVYLAGSTQWQRLGSPAKGGLPTGGSRPGSQGRRIVDAGGAVAVPSAVFH